ncbi:synaptic vesicle glycoprotein 2C [Genypterus blacodes]|uniref:synaptic vesicle glycoprotein 2C n=1 Tax=Genypterus blacodes TaxID=154954 RepID=UPI003F76EE40
MMPGFRGVSRRVGSVDEGVQEPLLTGRTPEPSDLDSEEGEILFHRSTSAVAHDAGESVPRRFTYEEAVNTTGFGLFHCLLLVVCGWANASDAVEILCVSFLLPTARCDLQLSSSDMGLLTASIFLGMMFGGYLWGYLADQRGRRRVLVLSLTINGLFGGLSSVAAGFWVFLLLRFISGFGVGGSVPVIFSYFSEFMPRLRRGAMISALATFWMAGNILAAGLAWWVIPSTWAHFSIGELNFPSWRVFVVLCSVPSITSAVIFGTLLPESPKFLMEVGREKEAIHVFQVMYKWNMRGTDKTLPEFGLITGSARRKEPDGNKPRGSCTERLSRVLKMGLAPIRELFTGVLRTRSIAMFIIFYCISFGYYGLWMWFPELLKRIEEGNSPCANASLSSAINNQSCYPVKTAVYMEGFVLAASNLPGNIFTILIMDSVGGKALLSSSLVLSGVCVCLIYLVQTKTQSLLFSCIFSGVSVISWNAIDVLSTELYPTSLRSSSMGFFTGVGRVGAIMGNVAFGKLVDSNCAVPILLVSALLASAGLVALILPQTKHAELT